jgi:bifunctional oligoribonuclease and PAP phosphatase NrnA
VLPRIVDAIRAGRRFVVASHARPDGDAIGSEMAMAYALAALGKSVRVVNRDPPPPTLAGFPGVADIELSDTVDGAFDVAIILECGELARTGVAGLDRGLVINIDHHPGNSGYGDLTWFDASAAACAELVFDLIVALGVPMTRAIAEHVYVAILTDTGGFHYSGISPRTFDICRQTLEAGADPVAIARVVFDSNSLGRLRLLGSILNAMNIAGGGRIAVLRLDEQVLGAADATLDDADGLINMPLTVKTIDASVFLKHVAGDEYRVSLRSKGAVDIGTVARSLGGGGHTNAAGCTVHGSAASVAELVTAKVEDAIERAAPRRQADRPDVA